MYVNLASRTHSVQSSLINKVNIPSGYSALFEKNIKIKNCSENQKKTVRSRQVNHDVVRDHCKTNYKSRFEVRASETTDSSLNLQGAVIVGKRSMQALAHVMCYLV